ncbi:DUF4870 domain-containing protein [Cellulomonas fimi]|uniref:DUF4870 domain-containing protein n=1 Tax=Cellulomonas fimi TaxID=1708 RepID=UPI00234C2AF5|nr:DUF4870 domain-containing protein [Cellulomonas fimi]MDC7121048.1 DUF4870 domain-containing protein [Cellulomonas fimi]
MTTPQPDPWAKQPDPNAAAGQPAGEPAGQPSGAQQPYGAQYGAQQPYAGAPQGAPAGYAQPAAPLRPDDEKTWAIVAHLLPLVGVGFIAPLVIWLVFRGRGPFLEHHAKESLNFQLTLLIAYVVGGILSVIGIGVLIILAVWVVQLVFGILAAVATSRWEWYRYPVNIRMVN